MAPQLYANGATPSRPFTKYLLLQYLPPRTQSPFSISSHHQREAAPSSHILSPSSDCSFPEFAQISPCWGWQFLLYSKWYIPDQTPVGRAWGTKLTKGSSVKNPRGPSDLVAPASFQALPLEGSSGRSCPVWERQVCTIGQHHQKRLSKDLNFNFRSDHSKLGL